MATPLEAFKTLKAWQVGVLMATLLGAAGVTYGAYAMVGGSGEAKLGENQQLIPVQLGDLVNQVSTNGSIIFPNRETLTFGTQGTVGEVFVEEGQPVDEGQELARLDETTKASLAEAVAQARVELRNAEDAVAKAKDPHTALDMAQAEATVANARLSLENVQDALASLLKPTSQDMAQAEAAVANARLSLKNVQDDLEGLLKPTDLDIAQAEAAVTSAKLSLENAQEALDTVKSGSSDEDIAKAQSQVDSTSTALGNASGDLSLARKEWNTKIDTVQDNFDAAREDYQVVFQKWLGIDPEEVEGDIDPDALLDAWGAELTSLFDPNARFQDSSLGFLGKGPPPNDPDTLWSELVVYAWMNLTPGHLLPTCEGIAITAGTQCVKKEMDGSWDALQSAADSLDTVKTQTAKAIANAEEAVTRAEDNLATAEEFLADLKLDPDPLEIENKEKQLALVLATLQSAEEHLKESQSQPNDLEVEAKRKQVAVAQANLDKAEEEIAELQSEPDALEMEANLKQIAVAGANLEKAEEDLAELRSSVDSLEVSLREAEVSSARLALETALQRLQSATLRAPMTGVISLVNVEAGQSVNANTRVVEVVDPTVVEVDGIVDEIDVLFVRVGLRAEVTMDALPGEVLEGTVSSVALAAETQQGVVSYPISIQVQLPQGIQPVEGLSATANIVIREDTDVLLVPLQALYGTFEQPLVRVSRGGVVEEQPVSVGNSDDFWAVVLEGLGQGDQVVIERAEASTDPLAQIRQQFQAGGRRGGGGLGGGGSGGLGGGGRPRNP